MRVLVIPEVYRPDTLSSNGTINDAVSWVDQWLGRDPALHVYWLLPTRDTASYHAEDVLADRRRVTLIEADPPMIDTEFATLFTENGYSDEQLLALRTHIFEQDAYLDVVVDQLRTGRYTLYKWLLEHTDLWSLSVRPFDVVANVHDFRAPYKHRRCSYRDAYHMQMELAGASFADGIWFTAGVDMDDFRHHASKLFGPEVVDGVFREALETGSPISFDRFEESYSPEPAALHIAGSLADKKHVFRVVDVAETLYERFGIETVMTSMGSIPASIRCVDWIDAHPHASRAVYERALERGDLAVCASEFDTMARTPFEQAASGQVLILRDERWIYDCVPPEYPFIGALSELTDLAVEVVEDWERAVAENRRLVAHLTEVRHPDRCGRRTYEDLRRRVENKRSRYEEGVAGNPSTSGKRPEVVSQALETFETNEVPLDDLRERTAEFTDDGRALTERESYGYVDLVYTLRTLGYEDTADPGTPVFRRRTSTA